MVFPTLIGENTHPEQSISKIKSGALVLDTMKIGYYTSTPEDYDYQMILSILRMVQWLTDNVLDPYPEKGYFLRERLSNGIELNEETNSYLINSYRHWKEKMNREGIQGIVRSDLVVDVAITYCLDPNCSRCSRLQQLQQFLC